MSKTKMLLVAVAAFTGLAVTTEVANAAIYCTYIGYPQAVSHGRGFVSLLGLLDSGTSPRRVRATETVGSTG